MKHHLNKQTILGLILLLAALWGGCFGLSFFHKDHWIIFPIFMTSYIIACFGFVCIMKGITNET